MSTWRSGVAGFRGTRRGVASGAAFAALLAASPPASGQGKTFCSEPVTPFCVNSSASFEDDAAKERCAGEVETYRRGLGDYVKCLGIQAKEANERGEEIARRYACMAEGREGCR